MKIKIKIKKTKKQKGGATNVANVSKLSNAASQKNTNKSLTPAEIDYKEAITYLIENELNHVKDLFEEITIFGKNKKISFNSYIKDTFLQGNHDANFYHEWYKGINPEFKIIPELKSIDKNGNETEFRLPEFKIFVANLAKDILMMILKNKFNDSNETNNNKTKYLKFMEEHYKYNISNYEKQVRVTILDEDTKSELLEILQLINKIIASDYIYIDIQNLYLRFILLVSIHKSECSTFIPEIIKIYEKTPYIVYPSYWTLDFKEIVNLCSTPIINFKYMNRRRKLHNEFSDPCTQIDHDITFHGGITHSYSYYFHISNYSHYSHKKTQNIKIGEMIDEFKKKFKEYFNTMNDILIILKEYYDYDEKFFKNRNGNETKNTKNTKKTYESLDNKLKKLCFGIVLFYVLHEINIESNEHKNNIKYFSETGKIIQFLNIRYDDIGTDDDPNSPTTKYPILKTIDWKSVYIVFSTELGQIQQKIEELRKLQPQIL